MYFGILDFFDELSPVEQSIHPAGYRQDIEECLRQEEGMLICTTV